MNVRIEKPLPGELDGDIDPEDYGFGVIKEEPPSEEEAAERVRDLYEAAKTRTGIVIPKIEKYLGTVASRASRSSAGS